MHRLCILLALVLLAAISPARADERLLIDEAGIKQLYPRGPVALRTVLASGDLLATCEPMRGQWAHLIVIDPQRHAIVRDVELPCHRIEYVQANQPGTQALVYSGEGARLLLIDLASGTVTPASRRQHGQAGVGLYSNARSRILPMGGDFCVFGYAIESTGRFGGDWLFRVGRGGVQKLMRKEALTSHMKRAFPSVTSLSSLRASETCLAVVGRARRGLAGLLLIPLGGRAVDVRSPLTRFGGMEIGPTRLIAIESANAGLPALTMYSPADKGKRRVLATGKLFTPALSLSERHAAAIEILDGAPTGGKGVRQQLARFDLVTGKAIAPVALSGTTLYLDVRFTNDGHVTLFDGSAVYRVDL